jgi:hypothetical protein
MEMAENGALGEENALADAPDVAGRTAHLDQRKKGDTDR